MVRKFLLIMFDSFVLVVIFVSLFQFASANLDLGGLGVQFNNDNYFGFYSLVNFFSDLGNNTDIVNTWNSGITWFIQCINYIKNGLIDSWNSITKNVSDNFFVAFANAFMMIYYLLASPIVLIVGLGGIIVYVIILAWNIITLFFKMLMGYYNVPVHTMILSNSSSLTLVYSF